MYFYHVVVLLFALLCLLPSSLAHMYLSSVTVGGQKQTEFDCIRVVGSNSPVMPVTSPDMTCGFKPNADKAANKKCPVAAGSKAGMQWYHNRASPDDDIVDGSHRGPCTVYMAKDDGTAPKWFKIWQSGYDETSKKFCVDTLIANRGYMEFTIPADVAPGNYLLRGEIIALHESYRVDGAQFYIGCAEITVSGSGKASPSTVSLPGAYKNTDPGLYIPNFYSAPITNYVVPGPAVYVAGTGGNNAGTGGNNAGTGGTGSGGDGVQEGKKKGGMSGGGAAALAIFLIAFVALLVCAAFYHREHGHVFGKSLPSNKYTSFLTPSASSSSSSSSAPRDRKQAGNYVAFVDNL